MYCVKDCFFATFSKLFQGCFLIFQTFILTMFCTFTLYAQTEQTVTTKMPFSKAYREGFAHNVMRARSKAGVQLSNFVLFENDGPGAGRSEKGAYTEPIYKGVLARKQFYLKDPRAYKADIVFYMQREDAGSNSPNPSYYLKINGTRVPGVEPSWNEPAWRKVKIPSYLLKSGLNNVIIGSDSPKGEGYELLFARADEYSVGGGKYTYEGNTAMISADQIRPDSGEGGKLLKSIKVGETSSKSIDGGETWIKGKLGPNSNIPGEYTIRLHLKRYKSKGTLSSPPVDLWANKKHSAVLPKSHLKKVKVDVSAFIPDSTEVTWQVRTSNTNDMLDDSAWSPWHTLGNGANKIFEPEDINEHRYLQWRAVLKTQTPLLSPVVKGVNIKYWVSRNYIPKDTYYIVDSNNIRLSYSSYRWTYQNSMNKELKSIRKRLNLDSVIVSGFRKNGSNKQIPTYHGMAKNEGTSKQHELNIFSEGNAFYKINLIRHYVSELWPHSSPFPNYPAWNANSILDRKALQGEGGFCLQYTITAVQALQSLGYQARFVNIYHHEPTEVYVNQLGKWVHTDTDGLLDNYEFNSKTGIPLDILEQHKYFLKEYGFSAKNPIDWESKHQWAGHQDGLHLGHLKSIQRQKQPVNFSTFTSSVNDPSDPPPLHNLARFIHYMLRTDYLSRPTPRPVNEGGNQWPWNGFLCWYDKATPRELQYALHTDRVSDVYPTLNRVQYTAVYGDTEGEIKIKMITNTPNFKTFEININEQGWQPAPAKFSWNLLPSALNNLKMRTVNVLGRHGKPSKLSLFWHYRAPYQPQKTNKKKNVISLLKHKKNH